MSLRRKIPFSVKHRLRRTFDSVRFFPRNQASCSVESPGALHRRYQAWYWDRHLRRFFHQFVRPGDLVFDVGAHVGLWTLSLASVGCRVVAVEPQAACAAEIAAKADDSAVTVVQAAVGAEAGEVELFISANTTLASTAREWMDTMVERAGVPADAWSGSSVVPVRTLDDLIDEFGIPTYVKLDIEGSEAQALSGLSRAVDVISFETHGQAVEYARAVVARLSDLGHYEFNLSPGEFPTLLWPEWRDASQLVDALERDPIGWNNVFARLARSAG